MPARNPNRRTNWRVRVYDRQDKVIESWRIQDRTEHEAENEAFADVNRLGRKAADWSMIEIKRRRK